MHPDNEPLRDDIAVNGNESIDSSDPGEVVPNIQAHQGHSEHQAALRAVASNSTADAEAAVETLQALEKQLEYQQLADRQATLLQTVALFLDQHNLKSSLMAVCESLHEKFNCTRVVASLKTEGSTDVIHISQQSDFDARSGEVQLLKDAMDEASDQDQLIHFTTGIDASNPEQTVVESHRAVLSGVRNGQIVTVPLIHDKKVLGSLLLEAHDENKWSQRTVELQRQIAETIAPLVAVHQQAELSLRQQLKTKATSWLSQWMSPKHMALKLAGAACLIMTLFAAVIPVTHEVQTSAELISTERRLITAPILGYVDSVHVAVGDVVKEGQPLLDLDTKDLTLQAQQYQSQIDNTASDYRAAMASHDRQEMAIVQAKLDQVRSELELINTQIKRAQIVAPVDGMIVNGDLAQLLGAPVERGKTLLEMAPASNYEIQLLVNEADISYVEAGQTGELTLQSNPFDPVEFSINAVHPIATVGDGQTRFRVDANPTSSVDGFRPGQTGVAKVEAGSANLLWTWTHRMTAWLKLKLWSWF